MKLKFKSVNYCDWRAFSNDAIAPPFDNNEIWMFLIQHRSVSQNIKEFLHPEGNG